MSDHYKHLTDETKETIENWQKESFVVGDPKDIASGLTTANRIVTKALADMAEDYGIEGFAVLTHPDAGIVQKVTGSEAGIDAFEATVQRINPLFDPDKFASIWNGDVSGAPSAAFRAILAKIMERRAREHLGDVTYEPTLAGNKRARGEDRAGETTPRTLVAKRAAAAGRLRVYLQPQISVLCGTEAAAKWAANIKSTKGPVKYGGFFDELHAIGLEVHGWPHACKAMLDVAAHTEPMTQAPGSALIVKQGSLLGTSSWRQQGADGLLQAMENNRLQLTKIGTLAPEPETGGTDDEDDDMDAELPIID